MSTQELGISQFFVASKKVATGKSSGNGAQAFAGRVVCPVAGVARRFQSVKRYFTSRLRASRYFSAVFRTISSGSSGAGGFWFQPIDSR